MTVQAPSSTGKLALPILAGATILTLLALVEFFTSRPFPTWLYFGVALLSCAPLFIRYRLRQLPIRLLLSALIFLLAAKVSTHGLGGSRPFYSTMHSIKAGSSEVEVDRIMAGYLEVTPDGRQRAVIGGPTRSGDYTGTRLFRRPVQGPYNDADRAIVHFQQGLVTRVEFSPD